MATLYVGQIIQGGWNFAPSQTALCAAQLMAISQNTALFSLLGTTYGGNGISTFGLPDLRGRTMINAGQGPGLSNYVLGETGGTEVGTVTVSNMASHTHTATFANNGSSFSASTTKASVQIPANGTTLGHSVDTSGVGAIPAIYCPSGTATNAALGGVNAAGTVTLGQSGSGVPFDKLRPYLAVTVAISLFGVFPSRN